MRPFALIGGSSFLLLVPWQPCRASTSTACAPSATEARLVVEDALQERARLVAALVAADPRVEADAFSAEFLAAVPEKRLASLAKGIHRQGGAVVEVAPLRRDGPWAGRFEFVLERERALVATLSVSSEAPHRIVGLYFSAPLELHEDWAALDVAARALPGRAALCALRLDGTDEPDAPGGLSSKQDKGAAPRREAGLVDEPLAIGSAFKLWILGALVDEVRAGRLSGAEVARLDPRLKAPPSGRMQDWPDGAPATLHTLAVAMVSESDNTATDHLLHALGRARVEAMLEPMGLASAARNLPLLATGEMFRIKCGPPEQRPWEELDLEGRRARLAGWAAEQPPRAPLDLARLSRPTRIETVEWFASARELARTLDWLRRATEEGPAAGLRAILAVNPGSPAVAARHEWTGFKGGSEPGVLCLAFLLKDGRGRWWALVGVHNDPQEALAEARLADLVASAARLLAREP
jgi:hypothetical protein